VDDVLLTVGGSDLALSIVEVTSDDHDLVILSNRHGSYAVLLSQLLRERGGHSNASLIGGSIEMSLSLLGWLRADVNIELHPENKLQVSIDKNSFRRLD
jgi:hypothetical protein